MKVWSLLIILSLIVSCSGEDSPSSGGSSESTSDASAVQVQIDSGDVSVFSSVGAFNVACNLSIGGVMHSGNCFTPISLKSKVFRINLSNSFGGPPARLIDFSASPEDNPTGGPHGLLGLTDYDFASAAQNSNPYSDDNLQDSTESYFNNVTMQVGAMEVKLEIPSGNGNVGDKFWTIRYMLLPQNPLDNSSIDSCVTDPSIRTHLSESGDLYSIPNGFSQGDILVCKKASSGAVCEDGDFQWIDSTNGMTSATRPASPVRLDGAHIMQTNSCEQGGGNLVMGGSNFKTTLSPAIRLNKSRDQENCMFKYDFQSNCTTTGLETGSCSDSAENGFGINVRVDFELVNALFVEGTLDLDTDTETNIQQSLNLILPKPLYVENNKAAPGTGDDTRLDAQISISIDNTIATNALTSRGENPDHYDENFCFIPQETGGN